jgi:hypothetical protein
VLREVDVAAITRDDAGQAEILCLGEAAGFSDELRRLAARSADIVLVDLRRLDTGE